MYSILENRFRKMQQNKKNVANQKRKRKNDAINECVCAIGEKKETSQNGIVGITNITMEASVYKGHRPYWSLYIDAKKGEKKNGNRNET